MTIKLKQVSKDYWIHHGKSNVKVKVKGRPVKLEWPADLMYGDKDWDLFSHKERFRYGTDEPDLIAAEESHCYSISEGRCGSNIYEGDWNEPLKSCVKKALRKIEMFKSRGVTLDDALSRTIDRMGISPRYERET